MKKFKCPKCKKEVDCADAVIFRKCEECKIGMNCGLNNKNKESGENSL